MTQPCFRYPSGMMTTCSKNVRYLPMSKVLSSAIYLRWADDCRVQQHCCRDHGFFRLSFSPAIFPTIPLQFLANRVIPFVFCDFPSCASVAERDRSRDRPPSHQIPSSHTSLSQHQCTSWTHCFVDPSFCSRQMALAVPFRPHFCRIYSILTSQFLPIFIP